ncbi:transposase [Patescibacteria group bacterium]|nr:transposase [Patescibacteria group bacterium]
MKRKEQFIPGEYYHIYSRTMLNIPEFKEHENAKRLHQAFLLANSTESGKAFNYLRTCKNPSFNKAVEIAWRGDKLVDVVAYVIMLDHYHLLLKELKEKGITDFLQKCNTSIAKYINTKKERKGPLFEKPFKAKHIDSNSYLLHLSLYIHLNPLDFIDNKNWRIGNLKNWNLKKKKLLDYPWSSLKSYLYKDYENWILSGEDIIFNQFKNKASYEKFLKEWSAGNIEEIII